MRAGAVYLLAHALVGVLGMPILMIPDVRSWRLSAKIAASLAAGAFVLAVEATLLTLLGISWSALLLLAPPVALTVFLVRRARSRAAVPVFRPGFAIAVLAAVAGGVALGLLGLSLAMAQSTSADFLLFWGVKAVRFASARAIDPALLRWIYFGHTQPFYPPLVPVLDAWGVLAAGRMPWRVAPLTALLWLAAAAALLLQTLRYRLSDRSSLIVTTFWTIAMSASLARSFSGGNAEAPLLLYETIGGALLLTESEKPAASRRFLAGVFLAGAVLTKVEGSIATALLIFGVAVRDSWRSRRLAVRPMVPLVLPPLFAGLLWLFFLVRFRIPVGYPGRATTLELHLDRLPRVLGSILENLRAGTHWMSWVLPLLLLLTAASSRRLEQVIPGVVAIGGLFVFFLGVYSPETAYASLRISWEIPRISQPALSLWIALAGLCTLPSRDEHQAGTV